MGGGILPPPGRRRAPSSPQLRSQLCIHLPVFYLQGESFTAIRHTSSSQLEGEERGLVKLPTPPRGGEDSRIAELAPLLADGLLAKEREDSHNLWTRSHACKHVAQDLGRVRRALGRWKERDWPERGLGFSMRRPRVPQNMKQRITV